MINVNIIRAFEGPRHDIAEAIWHGLAACTNKWRLIVHDNLGAPRLPEQMLEHMWEDEQTRPERFAVFSEFDFLPGPEFPGTHLIDKPNGPVFAAAEFVYRLQESKQLENRGCSAMWWWAADKFQLRGIPFSKWGERDNEPSWGDPLNVAFRDIERAGLPVCLIRHRDHYPKHYGASIGDIGTHMFWSRHWNQDPRTPLTFDKIVLGDVLDKLDGELERYILALPEREKQEVLKRL